MRLDDKNIIFDFDIEGNVLGGPSAGAAMTIATIAALEGKKVKEDVVVTGTILPGGEIGKISGVIEKAQVASENNVTLFLVPLGQSEVIYYEKVLEKKKVGGLELIRTKYVPKSFDLKKYAEENLDLRVEEVSRIREVMGYIF